VSRLRNHGFIWFWVISLLVGIGFVARPAVVGGFSPGRNSKFFGIAVLGELERNAPETYLRGRLRSPNIALSIPQVAMDGETVYFEINILAGNPINYHWSFETRSGARDIAQLKIENAVSPATLSVAYWYSTGHNKCGIDFTSVYTIKALVTFDNGAQVSKTASFAVSVGKNWGGNVDPPITKGSPEIRFDERSKQWVITGPGTLERVSNPLKLRLPPTSQFYEKVLRHEEVHVKQFEDGILSDLFRIGSLMDWLQKASLSDPDKRALEQKISTTISNWRQSQQMVMVKRLPAAEREAYAVSDQIAPGYIFQNCGRF